MSPERESRPSGGRLPDADNVKATVSHAADVAAEPRCRRCHRVLYTPLAVAAGLGPVCAMAAIAHVDRRTRDTVVEQYALPYEGVA